MRKAFKSLLLAFTTLFAGTVAYAQVTTSAVSGRIKDASGEDAIGAAVIAVHTPSGTTYSALTNASGSYSLQGLRPGGPYTVTVSLLGYQEATIQDLYLGLGETRNFSPVLNESSTFLDEAVVTARSDAGKTGAAQAINRGTIENMPSITRGIADVTRINPFVRTNSDGAMSFAGTNNRYNSFQIDGAMNNDVFGLTASGSNGGQAGTQPVSMETIAQVQVNIAPFDVRQSGFTGGAVNAVTKSGTNQFHGSVYGYGLNQALTGRYMTEKNELSKAMTDQLEYQAGVTVGGPIIKDKLFFFASFERSDKQYPNAYGLGSSSSKVNKDEAQAVLDYIKGHSSYTGDLPSDLNVYTTSNKATAKLDWNINDNHHASFRWSLVDAKQLNSVSGASALNSTDYSYDFLSRTNTFVGELQSRLSSIVTNEARVSYVRVRDKRNPLGDPFPMVSVTVTGGTVNIGNERSSEANRLDQDIFSITDNVTVSVGSHNITGGIHAELYTFTNLFIQDKYGTYYFDSKDDLLNGVIKQYRIAHANVDVTGDENWEPTFHAGQIGEYIQDKWAVLPNLELTYGIRVDTPVYLDVPDENKPFTEYASTTKDWNLRTNNMPKSLPLVSPRFGARWDIDGTGKYILRGGAGLFTGRIPFVWFSNNFSNTGVQLTAININRTSAAATMDQLSVILDPAGQAANEAKIAAAAGSQTLNLIDPKFRVAQNFRADIGFDFELLGIDWTVEGIFSKNINDVQYKQLAYDLVADQTKSTLGKVYPDLSFDDRPMFERVTGGSAFANIYYLTNTNKGYSYNLMAQARKHFGFGLDLDASYTFSQAKSAFNGTSSVAQSNFAYNYTRGNANDPELGNSAFNIPHQIKASAFYHIDYGPSKLFTTTVGAVYIGTSGAAYSVYYNGDINGDSSNGNDLMFIPTDAQIDKMTFQATTDKPAADQAADLNAWLGSDPYMSKHRGEYFERYADNLPFENHIDVHVGQKFGFRVGKQIHSVEITADIINFTNLLNPAWGRSYGMGLNSYYNPVSYRGNGQFQFIQGSDYNMRSYSDYLSRWKVQLGLRYNF
ncbi:MAG: TonB-dependent receptor [Bacteroidales bacterium]|nr:TonB-dependent receptor [Bacteroidales bacterium]